MSRHKRILFYCPFPTCKHSSTPLATTQALHSHLSTEHTDTVPSALVDALTSRGARPVPDLLLSLLQDWTTELSHAPVIWPLGRRRVVLCPLCPRPYLSVNAAYGSPLYKAVVERDAGYVVPGEMADRIWRHLRYHLESVAVLAHPQFVMPGRTGKVASPFLQVPGKLEGGLDINTARGPASLVKG
ncbi:hypothetical protein IQ07DRAFT_595014 [Pyrenochaeta sp. DS3sAY3a]|nr:hypothetical protein IQ07DRAFT_595014 [Pyrenochaeta sp. DS3sAY3a]